MELEVVGREAELASIRAFVERSDEGSAALVLEGEAGIGKSTLHEALGDLPPAEYEELNITTDNTPMVAAT
jgi:predicted ATPase